jgi:hypothetical protein
MLMLSCFFGYTYLKGKQNMDQQGSKESPQGSKPKKK